MSQPTPFPTSIPANTTEATDILNTSDPNNAARVPEVLLASGDNSGLITTANPLPTAPQTGLPDNTASGLNVTATTTVIVAIPTLNGQGTVEFDVQGTISAGSVVFEHTLDGGLTWNSVIADTDFGGQTFLATTSPGRFSIAAGGSQQIRARTSGIFSGTVSVYAVASAASPVARVVRLGDFNGAQTPLGDTLAHGIFTRPSDGTNATPAMDAVARAGYQRITDGANTLGVPGNPFVTEDVRRFDFSTDSLTAYPFLYEASVAFTAGTNSSPMNTATVNVPYGRIKVLYLVFTTGPTWVSASTGTVAPYVSRNAVAAANGALAAGSFLLPGTAVSLGGSATSIANNTWYRITDATFADLARPDPYLGLQFTFSSNPNNTWACTLYIQSAGA